MLANGELRFGGGNGLIGMRERATLLGGVLTPSALTARFGSERSFSTELTAIDERADR
jgi:signal transduction histidine kinase